MNAENGIQRHRLFDPNATLAIDRLLAENPNTLPTIEEVLGCLDEQDQIALIPVLYTGDNQPPKTQLLDEMIAQNRLTNPRLIETMNDGIYLVADDTEITGYSDPYRKFLLCVQRSRGDNRIIDPRAVDLVAENLTNRGVIDQGLFVQIKHHIYRGNSYEEFYQAMEHASDRMKSEAASRLLATTLTFFLAVATSQTLEGNTFLENVSIVTLLSALLSLAMVNGAKAFDIANKSAKLKEIATELKRN